MHFNCADFSGAEQEPIHLPLQQQKVVIFYGQKQQSPSHLHSHPYQQISFFKYWLFFSHYFFLMTCCPHVCDGVHALACIVCKCMCVCVCARAARVCVCVCACSRARVRVYHLRRCLRLQITLLCRNVAVAKSILYSDTNAGFVAGFVSRQKLQRR